MSGPWEDYAPASSGPWEDYAAPQTPQVPQQDPSQYDPNSSAFQARYGPLSDTAPDQAHPVTGEISSFLRNALIGAGKMSTDIGLGARQIAGYALPGEAEEKRKYDAPIMATGGGKAGSIAAVAPALFVPGANTYAGAALIGGGLGSLQPTMEGESRTLNAAIVAGAGVAGTGVGNVISRWLTSRSAAPFMGWSPGTANRVAAESVGSTARRLDQPALAETQQRLGGIFEAVRNPNSMVSFPSLNNATIQAVDSVTSGLNRSIAAALRSNADVADLLSHINSGGANAQQLGAISSNLGREAASQMTTREGDRALGRALFSLKEHVDDLVGSTITDPELASAYQAARGQYRNLGNITATPSILNSATGDVNMTRLAARLQRVDKPGYLRGGNQSDLYNAARWGQATGEGAGPPSMLTKFGLPWLGYRAVNNPLSNAIGGAVSRVGAPIAPIVPRGLEGLAIGSTPLLPAQSLMPYFEQ